MSNELNLYKDNFFSEIQEKLNSELIKDIEFHNGSLYIRDITDKSIPLKRVNKTKIKRFYHKAITMPGVKSFGDNLILPVTTDKINILIIFIRNQVSFLIRKVDKEV